MIGNTATLKNVHAEAKVNDQMYKGAPGMRPVVRTACEAHMDFVCRRMWGKKAGTSLG
jgi:hypothetical protein